MTEQERVDKLKARMSRWQAYVDKPQANTLQQKVDMGETHGEGHQGRTVRKADGPPPNFLLEPVQRATPERKDIRAQAPSPDPLAEIQEARIADLKTAIAREQEQADRLAEEIRRAQTLHAATIYAHLADEKVRNAETRPTLRQIPEAPPTFYDEERRKNLAVMIGLLLIITSVCVVTFFITR